MCQICDQQHFQYDNSRRRFLRLLGATTAGYALAGVAFADVVKVPPKPQNVVTPDEALALLKAGNARYVEGVMKRHDFRTERESLTRGQNPYAAILSCADSRVSPELAFDSARGDLFVCRVAGNFANDDIVASFEYAVAELNTPLIMVLGHSACGAVSAAIKSLKDKTTLPGHLPSLVKSLTTAIRESEGRPGDLLDNAITQNVIDNVQKLKGATPILSAAIAQGKLRVVGAIYRLADGRVDILT
jgi:carbonic anhydrase